MRRWILLVLSLLLSLLGLATIGAPAASATPRVTAHIYDLRPLAVVQSLTTTGRGPPTSYDSPTCTYVSTSLSWRAHSEQVAWRGPRATSEAAPADTLVAVSSGGVAAKSGVTAVEDVGDVLRGLPKGRSSGVRTVGSDQELGDLYGTLTRGGTPVEVPGYPGSWVELPNGTRVSIRDASKSGGRTIDIKMPDGTKQKVHIDE